jgi:hypothetical protein
MRMLRCRPFYGHAQRYGAPDRRRCPEINEDIVTLTLRYSQEKSSVESRRSSARHNFHADPALARRLLRCVCSGVRHSRVARSNGVDPSPLTPFGIRDGESPGVRLGLGIASRGAERNLKPTRPHSEAGPETRVGSFHVFCVRPRNLLRPRLPGERHSRRTRGSSGADPSPTHSVRGSG